MDSSSWWWFRVSTIVTLYVGLQRTAAMGGAMLISGDQEGGFSSW